MLGIVGWGALLALAGTPDARWVRHTLSGKEKLRDVAERFQVSQEQVREWNGGDRLPKFKRGVILKIRARQPPRQRKRFQVGKKETWDGIASRYAVKLEDLRRWNRRFKRDRPPRGASLVVWVDSDLRQLPPSVEPPLPAFTVRAGGQSVGRPNRGRLRNGVQLPKSELYRRKEGRIAYGSSLTVQNVLRAIAGFRGDTGFRGLVYVGAMSRRTGRRLRPHKSHQSGRDVDVRLPAMPFASGEHDLSRDEVDWHATWSLLDAFVRTGVVQVVFLERKLWRALKKAGMRMGASDEQLRRVFRQLRHSKGHVAHMHVRFVCSPEEPDCKD